MELIDNSSSFINNGFDPWIIFLKEIKRSIVEMKTILEKIDIWKQIGKNYPTIRISRIKTSNLKKRNDMRIN